VDCDLSRHDYGGENLAAYSVSMRHHVEAIRVEEHQYDTLPLASAIGKLRAVLDSRAGRWQAEERFKVLWKITGQNGEAHTFGQQMPSPTESCSPNWEYDLLIELPSYRLQRLTHGDYKMGFITLWNGSARCHRHVESQTAAEKAFWAWAFDNVRLQ
jgi:hypothetical protein